MTLENLKENRYLCQKIFFKYKIYIRKNIKRGFHENENDRYLKLRVNETKTQYRNSSTAGWNRLLQWEIHLIKGFLAELEFLLAIYGLMYASTIELIYREYSIVRWIVSCSLYLSSINCFEQAPKPSSQSHLIDTQYALIIHLMQYEYTICITIDSETARPIEFLDDKLSAINKAVTEWDAVLIKIY